MPDLLPIPFLIKRAEIKLKVYWQTNACVQIEPFECKPENMRLCRSIAQVQNTKAQLYVEANQDASPQALLFSLFDEAGWEIELIARK